MGEMYDHNAVVAVARQRVEKFINYYAAGGSLFSRAAISELDRQLDSDVGSVCIKDFLGLPQNYSKVPPWTRLPEERRAKGRKAAILYSSYQALTNHDPSIEYYPLSQNALSISYVRFPDRCGWNNLDQIQANFENHGEKWLESEECRAITRTMVNNGSRKIRKIVAFALGSLSWRGTWCQARTSVQHSAVLAIAAALEKINGHAIKCYVQDPIYGAADKEFLRSKGFVILQDPKGFLEVDEQTLVISISPNVPVKQIIADIARPAAMIWDAVRPEEEEHTEWRTEVWDGEPSRVSPYSTDPDSPRVRDMITDYKHFTFPDEGDHFGDLGIYIRNTESPPTSPRADSLLDVDSVTSDEDDGDVFLRLLAAEPKTEKSS